MGFEVPFAIAIGVPAPKQPPHGQVPGWPQLLRTLPHVPWQVVAVLSGVQLGGAVVVGDGVVLGAAVVVVEVGASVVVVGAGVVGALVVVVVGAPVVVVGPAVVVVGAAVVVVAGGAVVVVAGATHPRTGSATRPDGQRHPPLTHWPPAHDRPHAPQLAGSRLRSKQPVGQGSVPGGQEQSPFRFAVWPGGQAVWAPPARAPRRPAPRAAIPPRRPRRVFGPASDRVRASKRCGSTPGSLPIFGWCGHRAAGIAPL
jgi:hypothetical protein